MASGTGTGHHKLRSLTGLITIIALPIALFGLIDAVPNGAVGFTAWLSNPILAIGLLIFMTAALWYCKLEFDEVILDYTDGGLRSFGLLANRLIAFLAWAIAVFSIIKIWLGA